MQSISQSFSKSRSQSVSHSVSQSVIQSVGQSASSVFTTPKYHRQNIKIPYRKYDSCSAYFPAAYWEHSVSSYFTFCTSHCFSWPCNYFYDENEEELKAACSVCPAVLQWIQCLKAACSVCPALLQWIQCLNPHSSVLILKEFVTHCTGINSCISLVVLYDSDYFVSNTYCLLGCVIYHCECNSTTPSSNP
jgi:hypothetical protein